jgi:hypothetical protein
VELFPEDSPIGTCKRQAPDVEQFQKRPYSCFAVENGIFAKEVVYKWVLKRYILTGEGAYFIHTNYARLNRVFLSTM